MLKKNKTKIFGACIILILTSIGSTIGTSASEDNNMFEAFNINDYTIEININSPSLIFDRIDIDSESYTTVDFDDEGFAIILGEAKLPVIKRMIEIPQGAVPEIQIDSLSWDLESLTNIGLPSWIVPVQPSDLKIPDALGEFIIDLDYYNDNKFSPNEIVKITEIGEIRGRRFALVEVSPVQYNPVTGELKTIQYCSIILNLHSCNLQETNEKITRYTSPSFEDMFGTMFENYGHYESHIQKNQRDQEGFLIIVYDNFFDEIQPLVNIKEGKGFDLTVTKTSDIPGGVTKENIHNYIEDAYENWNIPPTYVLLVGDTPQIPSYPGTTGPSAADFYYVTINAEDYFPDMFIGRFPAADEADVEAMVDKTVYYEEGAFQSNEWIKKAAFLAGVDNYQISEGTHNYVIENYLDPNGYTCDKLYMITYGATTQDVKDSINDGRSLVIFSGHGSSSSWGDGPSFSKSNVNDLTNDNMYPFVCSHSCSTGTFDVGECFGETWLRAADKAGLAFWGASASTYWDEDDVLEKKMFSAWWDDGLETIGGMTDMALYYLYQEYGGGGLTKYYFEAYNILGDPSVSIWSDDPTEPPETPSQPDGPEIGIPLVEYEYSTSTIEPDGDQVYYMWDWGDGTFSEWLGPYPSGQISYASNIWTELGEYIIRVKAKDNFNAPSDWSEPLIISIIANSPPDEPLITGPGSVKPNKLINFKFMTTDPDGHELYYFVSWGDDNFENWVGPYSSGEEATLSHSWGESGDYIIITRAKDEFGAESPQSIHKLSAGRSRFISNPILLRFLEKFPNAFPLIRQLLAL